MTVTQAPMTHNQASDISNMTPNPPSPLAPDDISKVVQIGSAFDDFESFQEAFKVYQQAKHQLFVIKRSKTVRTLNRGLDPPQTLNAKLVYGSVTYICKHGGAPRIQGKGVRPNQR